jgi:molybdopterin-guanine dinucleotide biosynthesis protein MobB
MAPVDLILVEGWKRDKHPKIEAYRAETNNPLIAPDDPTIKAIASDTAITIDRPVFDLNDTTAIAEFILSETGL